MAMNSLEQQIVATRRSLLDEGILDEYFIRLEELVNEENPHFIEEIITLFLESTSTQVMDKLEPNIITMFNQKRSVEEISDAKGQIDTLVHAIIGSSSSIGAKKITQAATLLKEQCNNGDKDGARTALQVLRNEFNYFADKITPYIKLLHLATAVLADDEGAN